MRRRRHGRRLASLTGCRPYRRVWIPIEMAGLVRRAAHNASYAPMGPLTAGLVGVARVVMVLAGVLGRRVSFPSALSGLIHDEPLGAIATIRVAPACRAAAARGARHREDRGARAHVEGTQAGHLDRPAPHAVPLDGHEPLLTAAVRVAPPAAQWPGEAHDTDVTKPFPPVFRAARPGTSIARPQTPFVSLTTNPWL